MSTVVAGCGWVTPLGAGLEEVWTRLMAGQTAEAKPLTNPETGRVHAHLPVPPKLVEHLGRQPRLRRASPISYFAVAAALAAWGDAGFEPPVGKTEGLAVIFAVSSGSVLYTRKFYEQIHKTGASTASPALFPETVYNAAASHVAAAFGLDGISYTLVGDSSIGLAALKLGEQLLATGAAERCLVVAAEELDWVLCEGYRDWRIATRGSTATLYERPARGALLAEAGAAVLLAREGSGPRLRMVHEGLAFQTRVEARAAIRCVTAELVALQRPDAIVASANGSALDLAEADALRDYASMIPVTSLKGAFGEALGASALLQVVGAAQALRTGQLPPVNAAGIEAPPRLVRAPFEKQFRTVTVLSTGLNQQASGAILTAP